MKYFSARPSKYSPLNNFLFHKIFGEKGDEVQLLGFINAVLGKQGNGKFIAVEILEIKSFAADMIGGKSCVLDVRAKLPGGALVNIEVQLRDKYNMNRRSLFYMGREYANLLNAGDDYIRLPDLIAINIVNYDFPPTRGFHSCFHLREDVENGIILTKALEIHYINMVKYRKQRKNSLCLDDPLHRWLEWFDRNSRPEILKEVLKMDYSILTAEDRYNIVTNMDGDEWIAVYNRWITEYDRKCDIHSAHEKGLAKGIEKERREIARSLLAEGSTPEFVQKITGLDLNAINKLTEQMRKK